MIVRLAHVCIESKDLGATESFYGYLGITRKFEFRNKQKELVGMYLDFGHDTFFEMIKVTEPRKEGISRHFAIEVKYVEAVRKILLEKGVEVSDKRLGVDHTWMLTCHDPNGIFIEFHEYTKNSLQKTGGSCEIDYRP